MKNFKNYMTQTKLISPLLIPSIVAGIALFFVFTFCPRAENWLSYAQGCRKNESVKLYIMQCKRQADVLDNIHPERRPLTYKRTELQMHLKRLHIRDDARWLTPRQRKELTSYCNKICQEVDTLYLNSLSNPFDD